MSNIKKLILALLTSSTIFTISPITSVKFSPKVEINTVINVDQ